MLIFTRSSLLVLLPLLLSSLNVYANCQDLLERRFSPPFKQLPDIEISSRSVAAYKNGQPRLKAPESELETLTDRLREEIWSQAFNQIEALGYVQRGMTANDFGEIAVFETSVTRVEWAPESQKYDERMLGLEWTTNGSYEYQVKVKQRNIARFKGYLIEVQKRSDGKRQLEIALESGEWETVIVGSNQQVFFRRFE